MSRFIYQFSFCIHEMHEGVEATANLLLTSSCVCVWGVRVSEIDNFSCVASFQLFSNGVWRVVMTLLAKPNEIP